MKNIIFSKTIDEIKTNLHELTLINKIMAKNISQSSFRESNIKRFNNRIKGFRFGFTSKMKSETGEYTYTQHYFFGKVKEYAFHIAVKPDGKFDLKSELKYRTKKKEEAIPALPLNAKNMTELKKELTKHEENSHSEVLAKEFLSALKKLIEIFEKSMGISPSKDEARREAFRKKIGLPLENK